VLLFLIKTCKDLFNLFFPSLCSCCNNSLTYNEALICINCLHDLPFSNFSDFEQNPIEKSFYGRVPIHSATSLLLFYKEGKAQKLIHQLKYNNQQKIGDLIGTLLSEEIKNSSRFTKIDFIVPVPLHAKKLKQRGYNQLTQFGTTIAKNLKSIYSEQQLIKLEISETQTKKVRFDRWENAATSFRLIDITKFENAHILLIDDVITTGATIEACCNELLKTKNITISVATIAYTY